MYVIGTVNAISISLLDLGYLLHVSWQDSRIFLLEGVSWLYGKILTCVKQNVLESSQPRVNPSPMTRGAHGILP